MTADIRPLIGLPPEDTFRAFRGRDELRLTAKWHEMYGEEHARSFTVAHLAKLDLLDTVRNSLADVTANGGTFEQWKDRIIPDLQRAGWWGRVEDKSLTGTSAPVFIGPRRLETIYRTNMRVSRAAGQWARIQDRKDVAPFLRYSAVMDDRTRPMHRLWHGTILPVDDPWWNTHFPPCGWNCRCIATQLSERDLRARGWEVSKAPPPAGTSTKFWRAGSPTPEEVPEGIDPGWAYNPGKASMQAIADKAAATLDRTAAGGNSPQPAPAPAAAPLPLETPPRAPGSPSSNDAPPSRLPGRAPGTTPSAPAEVDIPAAAPAAPAPATTPGDLAGARNVLRDLVDLPAFPQALVQPGTSFPVMVLDDAMRSAIGADTNVAMLSSDTFAKQRSNHPELTLADYRRLPDIGAAPDLVFQQDDRRLILTRTADGRWMKAVVKVTADRGQIFVTSLQYARPSEILRLRRRFKLLFGQWVGAIAALVSAGIAADQQANNSDAANDGTDPGTAA